MLALTTLDRDNSVSPSATERSQHKLAGRDCMAQEVVSGGQKVRPSRQIVETALHRVEWSWQGGMGSRPLGKGGRLS